MKKFKKLFNIATLASVIGLVGCGSDDATNEPSTCFDFTQENSSSVQWSKVISGDYLKKLSDYKLFEDNTNPTVNPQSGGLPYDLTTPLFTDYATKYRYAFVPPGCSATYKADEAFDFPVGSALVKTFTLPSSTSNRGFENEDLIETRLLIKRESGWIALPYVWNAEKTEAFLDDNGPPPISSLEHGGNHPDLNYLVPDPQSCQNCHQIKASGDIDEGGFGQIIPIGPKARFLNKDYNYDSGNQNQLSKWVSEGILTGVPTDLSTVDQTPVITDDTNIADMDPSELETAARAWLDINCAHCHRRTPSGMASNTNMHVEWTRLYSTNAGDFGTCEKPISFGGNDASADYIIEPGDASKSVMVFRMNTTDGGDRMPPLGRELIHTEGVELISAWINGMATDPNCI